MAVLTPPGPFPLTAPQAAWLGRPPKPYEPNVPIVTPEGRPSEAYARYLTLHYEWERRLYAVLTGIG